MLFLWCGYGQVRYSGSIQAREGILTSFSEELIQNVSTRLRDFRAAREDLTQLNQSARHGTTPNFRPKPSEMIVEMQPRAQYRSSTYIIVPSEEVLRDILAMIFRGLSEFSEELVERVFPTNVHGQRRANRINFTSLGQIYGLAVIISIDDFAIVM